MAAAPEITNGRRHRFRAQYRQEAGYHIIDLTLREPRQLFNNLDPAPFQEKDLDGSAELYIVDSLEELNHVAQVRMMVHLPRPVVDSAEALSIPAAIAHYFDYRAVRCARELATLLRTGLVSLVIGLMFLALCLGARSLLQRTGDIPDLVAEGLLIMGWVAMWRPIELFLYDWWPIRRRMRTYERAAGLPVELRAMAQDSRDLR